MNPLRFPLQTFTLDNGLDVYFHHDATLPLVAVNIWYHVGSKDDPPHRTGLAHLFEHLMFEGSAGHNDEYFKPLHEAGASVNGSTGHDRTTYYEVVPSAFLELALWLEADRMGYLLPVLTPGKLENQRAVVKNERRQRVDNQPYGRVSEELARLFYPEGHPYRWPIIGSMEHLDDMTLADARDFFHAHYQPRNACLILAGQFDGDQARRWIDQYFGPIPGRDRPNVSTPAPLQPFALEKRRRLEDGVALARLDLAWPTVPRFHPHEPALDFAAEVLGGQSKDSRLKRRLVRDTRLATSVVAYHQTMRWSGQFVIRAYALAGVPPEALEAAILEELESFRHRPPDEEEIQRARNTSYNHALNRVETILGKADALNYYRYYQGQVHADSFLEELAWYREVTAEEVSAVLEQYLRAGRVVIEVVPERSARLVKPTPEAAAPTKESGSPAESLPPPGSSAPFRLPQVQRATAGNGLRLVVVRQPKLPRVDFQLLFDMGAAREPAHRLGMARLTADLLDEGTFLSDGLELARRLDRLGAQLQAHAGLESANLSLRVLRSHLSEALDLFAEVIAAPRFAEEDLRRERERLRAELAHRAKQPSSMADDAIDEAIYGAHHPYGRPSDGTLASIDTISRDDLAEFYRTHGSLSRATLLAVGDIDLDEVLHWLEERFPPVRDGLAATALTEEPAPNLTPAPGEAFKLLARPGAAQAVVRVGRLGPPRANPDYFALLLLNTVLGGQFASRLNLKLREEKGYTYGARSAFSLRRHAGAFVVGADVQSSATADTIREILASVADLGDANPVTARELAYAQAYLARRFPARFETIGAVASHLAQLAIYDLPDDFYNRYLDELQAVTLEQVTAAARLHLAAEGMKVVVVGCPERVGDVHHVATRC